MISKASFRVVVKFCSFFLQNFTNCSADLSCVHRPMPHIISWSLCRILKILHLKTLTSIFRRCECAFEETGNRKGNSSLVCFPWNIPISSLTSGFVEKTPMPALCVLNCLFTEFDILLLVSRFKYLSQSSGLETGLLKVLISCQPVVSTIYFITLWVP